MLNLKGTLESFSLSEDTRRKILIEDHPFGNQGNPFIPSEFKEIAQIALAGHFLVSTGIQQVTVPQFGITECLIQYKCSENTPPPYAIRSG